MRGVAVPCTWPDDARVDKRRPGPSLVVRKAGGSLVYAQHESHLWGVKDYKRVPVELFAPSVALSDDDRTWLEHIARFVARLDVCTHLLPCFVEEVSHNDLSPGLRAVLDRVTDACSSGF